MRTTKHLSAGIVALALVTGTALAQQQAGQKPTQQRPENPTTWGAQTREEKRKLREVREKQGLHEAAKLYGGYVEVVDFDYEMAADGLPLLADASQLVGRGLVKSNWSRIVRSKDEGYPEPVETIVTDYTVQLLNVYKGDPKLIGRDITVRIPGGRVEFKGGLWAEVRHNGFAPPQDQEEFILFLNPTLDDKKVYSVTFKRQGLFQVMPEGWVSPRARPGSPVSKLARRDLREFLKQLDLALGESRAKR